MATAVQAQSENPPQAVSRPQARRLRQFDGRDVWVVAAMAGIPTILHIGLVWIPTIFSIIFSFTNWNGIRLDDLKWVGFLNYVQIFTVFQKNFFQALINNTVLLIFLFIGPTALGICLAYLLGGGQPIDWLGNQTFMIPFGDTYGVSWNFVAILVAIAWRHTGYIMVLYLAGLKSVDSSLREAAMLDGSNEWQTFRNVVFPSLKPINVVIAVITVIEALRAFDIIYVLNTPRKTEVLSILTTNNLLGEGGGNVGRGSAYATILFILCFGFVIWYVTNHYRNTQEGADT